MNVFIIINIFSCSKKADSVLSNIDSVKTDIIPVYNNYLNDTMISDSQGKPKLINRKGFTFWRPHVFNKKIRRIYRKKTPAYFLPFTLKDSSGIKPAGIDSVISESITCEYSILNEPLFYNFYTGEDKIRMYFISAFADFLVTTVTRHNDKVVMRIITNNSDGTLKEPYEKVFEPEIWDTLMTTLIDCGFWTIKPYTENTKDYTDGYNALIECHFKNTYWYVYWENDNPAENTMSYILKLSGIHDR